MYLASVDNIYLSLSVSVPLWVLISHCVLPNIECGGGITVAGNDILLKAVCLSFHAPSLSLDDLFHCFAMLGSSFRTLGQHKPCHNFEFLTELQLPGRATVDQRRINTGDKLCQRRARLEFELGKKNLEPHMAVYPTKRFKCNFFFICRNSSI